MCKHRLHIWLFAEPLDSFGLRGSSPLCLCWCCIWLWWVPSRKACCRPVPHFVWVLSGIPNTISGRHCPPGHRGCSAGTGALMQGVCTLASLFNSAIHRLSKILQWEEQQRLRLLRLALVCSTVLFPCLGLSACSRPARGELGFSVCPGDQQLLPSPGASRLSLFLSLDSGGLWEGFALRP